MNYDNLRRSATAPFHCRIQSSGNSPSPGTMIQSVRKRRTRALVSVSAEISEEVLEACGNIILESIEQTDIIYE